MEVVESHSTAVFGLKLTRAIAEALSIDRKRVKVRGFESGSVKVLLSFSEGTPVSAQKAIDELQKQLKEPTSKLRLGEMGPFLGSAELETIPVVGGTTVVASMASAFAAPPVGGATAQAEKTMVPKQAWGATQASTASSERLDQETPLRRRCQVWITPRRQRRCQEWTPPSGAPRA